MTEQPELNPQHIIDTLLEENKTISENRLYLLALLRQLKQEFENEKLIWEAERESLLTKKE